MYKNMMIPLNVLYSNVQIYNSVKTRELFTKFEKGKDGYCNFDVNTYTTTLIIYDVRIFNKFTPTTSKNPALKYALCLLYR